MPEYFNHAMMYVNYGNIIHFEHLNNKNNCLKNKYICVLANFKNKISKILNNKNALSILH